jgi:hypothetical protein
MTEASGLGQGRESSKEFLREHPRDHENPRHALCAPNSSPTSTEPETGEYSRETVNVQSVGLGRIRSGQQGRQGQDLDGQK